MKDINKIDITDIEYEIVKIQQANSLLGFVNVAMVEGSVGRFNPTEIDNALSGINHLIGEATQEIMTMIFGGNSDIEEK